MSVIQPRTAVVTIYQGDHLDQLRHLERRFDEAIKAESGTPRTNDEVPESISLKQQHDALRAEAEATAINVTVVALGRSKWRELVKKYPAREGNETDAQVGVNEDEFKDALVPASILSATVNDEPVNLGVSELDLLADADFDRLYLAAFALNRLPGSDPKALASPGLLANQRNGTTSN